MHSINKSMDSSHRPMTGPEKIIAKACNLESVKPGDIVFPVPDMVMVHDNVLPSIKKALDSIGIHELAEPEKVILVTDHEVLYGSPRAALYGVTNRQAAKTWKVDRFYDVGRGGHGHIFPIEMGLIWPGAFMFDNDRHCTNVGAVGAVGFRVGLEMSRVLATGTNWISVPKSLKLTLKGRLPSYVHARDLGHHIGYLIKNKEIPFDLDYRILEFAGDLDQLSLASRVALCSTPTELGAYGVFFPPSQSVLEHAKSQVKVPFKPLYSDPDAEYEAEAELDLNQLEPLVSLPGGVHNTVPISKVAGRPIQHAFIGSCGSSMYDDISVAANVLKSRSVASGVRLFVVPGSEQIMKRLASNGLLEALVQSGALVLPPGCGPCNDAVVGPLHSGEVSISTATNNNQGRFGSKDAELYLASPATVAASAVAGCIADPRKIEPLIIN